MKFISALLYIIIALLLTACPIIIKDRNGKFLQNPVNLESFNSEFDDYNSVLPQNKYGSDYLIFSSKRDRKDVFNLVIMPFEVQYDDKNETIYLTSNRTGGKGGFDIYYSSYKNGQWTAPENMGSRINTNYDEYRPIVMNNINFLYHLGIFSSNRPNGKGGFDLYMAGFLEHSQTK